MPYLDEAKQKQSVKDSQKSLQIRSKIYWCFLEVFTQLDEDKKISDRVKKSFRESLDIESRIYMGLASEDEIREHNEA